MEVEYYNEGRRVKPPRDAFVTQVIKTDPNGVFSYTMPRAGWWGFAALVTGRRENEESGRQAGRSGIGRADVGQSGRYAGEVRLSDAYR